LSSSFYESDRAIAEYLLFHYGVAEQVMPYHFGPGAACDFPVRCLNECLDKTRLGTQARALDLGCAVGRSTFELARCCFEVIGIDYSRPFVETASALRQAGAIDFNMVAEGVLMNRLTAKVPGDIDRSRVLFEQGDAMNLPDALGGFDVVLMSNLIDRLRDPRRCLERLPSLVKTDGQLIITSPYTWLEDYTPRENWLGGFERNGKAIRTLDSLQEILGSNFRLSFCKDLPFLIREHARKFQWSVAEATVWLRK
jgi:putative 4-mercaptohistidine N1-methyltranferase